MVIFGGLLVLCVAAWQVGRQVVFRRRRRSFSIRELPDFLSASECDHLIALAEPRLEESKVVREGGRQRSTARVAMSAVLDVTGDRLVRVIKQRMADATDVKLNQLENLQVTRYTRLGYFAAHTDSLAGRGVDLGPSGDRPCTMIVYLNDDYSGGRTRFPKVGRSIRPERGKAVIFPNLDENGKPHPYALHLGVTVLRGNKWIINQLMRERPFRAPSSMNRASRRRQAARQRG